jgi:alkylhydroperoxidase/carboxymuconolactone decarboxylase family protein YurZ
MNKITRLIINCFAFLMFISLFSSAYAQNVISNDQTLNLKEKSIISISMYAAKGDLSGLKTDLNTGLENGLTINEIKEVLVHIYAYCGFPRSIRGLQTFMEVLDERKSNGIIDVKGDESSPIKDDTSKYEKGKKVLSNLLKSSQDGPLTGYSAFAPVIDTFLKEHLFADIFERDVLTYAQRELVTVSVLSTLGGVEPMLRSHLSICLNVGFTPIKLKEFVQIVSLKLGRKEAKVVNEILNEVLKAKK